MTMKKILLSFLALGGLLFASSCQMDEPDAGTLTGEVDFTITAGIPGGITTYSPTDGEAFSHLGGINNVTGDYVLRFILEVYDGDAVAYEEIKYLDDFSNPNVTFNPRLLAKEYDFVFWADFVEKPSAEGSTPTDLYYSTANLSSIEYTQAVKETPTVLTTDLVDAYTAHQQIDLSESSKNVNVILTRPLGKIRLLATDNPQNQIDDALKVPASTAVAFRDAKVPVAFNARTGEASEPVLSIAGYTFNAINETQPQVTGHSELAQEGQSAYLLGQTYFFESPSSTAYGMTLTVYDVNGTQIGYREVTAIPVSANKLTTVLGNFYTNEGNLDVIVDDQFGNGEGVISADKWDGNSIEAPEIDKAEKTISINSPAQFAGLAALVNEGNTYEDYTATLHSSIDLDNHEWTPVATGTRNGSLPSGNSFKGTFDGNGNTIYNLSIKEDPENADQAIGLFGIVDGGTVKNLKFENVNINVPSSEMAAAAVGMLTGGGTVSGIEVLSGTINATRGNGAVVGRMTKSGTISTCTNHATITGNGANIGGIVGAAYYTEDGSTMTIKDCNNYGTVSGTAGAVGGIVGLSAANVINCTNEAAITGNGPDVAGIVAEQQNAGSITGCVNKGDITNNASAYGTGGIVGWIRYNGTTDNYPAKNVIEVSGNTNYGSVKGGNDAGGIVGTVYNLGNIIDNRNYAPALSAATFASGIVGNAQFTEEAVGMEESNMVYVTGNFTTTGIDKISAPCKDLFVYINEKDAVTEENNTLLINTAEQLSSFAAAVNGGSTFSGTNVALGADIDLNNETWTPIGMSGKAFQGNFDGNGHKISNLKAGTNSQKDVGLFGFTTNGTIKNIHIHNAEIKGYLNVGVVAGTPYTTEYSDIKVTGLVKVEGYAYVGGMFGKNAYANLTDLTINADEGSYVKAESENYRTYVGGVVGFMGEGGHSVTNVVSNIDVYGSTCDVGGITGIAHFNNKFINFICTGNVTLGNAQDSGDQLEIGGIAGVWHNEDGTTVTFTDCSFTGTLTTSLNGVDYSEEIADTNKITGRAYSTTGTGQLIIDGVVVSGGSAQ